jgi:hypothetical protein
LEFLQGYDEAGIQLMQDDLELYFAQKPIVTAVEAFQEVGLKKEQLYFSGFTNFAQKIPSWIFILFTFFMIYATYKGNLSLIPLLGLLSCLYMMSQVELANWIAFTIWLLVGLVIYFIYSKRNSKLNQLKISEKITTVNNNL